MLIKIKSAFDCLTFDIIFHQSTTMIDMDIQLFQEYIEVFIHIDTTQLSLVFYH